MSEVMKQIEELEQFKLDQKTLATAGEQAKRLFENKDFKALILDGFCLHEAARYAQESGDPMLTADQRQDALNMAQASGHLKRFLSITCVVGNTAADNIIKADIALDEARAEANQ